MPALQVFCAPSLGFLEHNERKLLEAHHLQPASNIPSRTSYKLDAQLLLGTAELGIRRPVRCTDYFIQCNYDLVTS
jgi:hypothetical protein